MTATASSTGAGRLGRPLAGLRSGALAGGLFAIALSVLAVILVNGQSRGTVLAAVVVLTMTLPVAFVQRAPVATAAVLAAGAVLNELVAPHVVRCGAALPAVFAVAYVAGTVGPARTRYSSLGGALVSVVVQCIVDPQLGAGVIGLMAPITLLFFTAGLFVRSRSAMITTLRLRTTQLREQREQTARLAVAADRARITADLTGTLRRQIGEIVRTAQAAPDDQSATARFAAIETAGRGTLVHMREVVGTLRVAPTEPEPGLDALAELLHSATCADARLSIEGDQRRLPASIELTTYRIIEHLLGALVDEPNARVQVAVRFAAEYLELRVVGPPAQPLDTSRVLSLVRARAAIHGGIVSASGSGDRWRADVRLPLITSHA